jgi:hypothetical protein
VVVVQLGVQNGGICRQVVAIRRWPLIKVRLYLKKTLTQTHVTTDLFNPCTPSPPTMFDMQFVKVKIGKHNLYRKYVNSLEIRNYGI